jgi:DUF2934 family protein
MSKQRNKQSNGSSKNTRSDLAAHESPLEGNDGTGIDSLIRMRAYELYLERGDNPTDELGDWLRAEREYAARGHDEPAMASRYGPAE